MSGSCCWSGSQSTLEEVNKFMGICGNWVLAVTTQACQNTLENFGQLSSGLACSHIWNPGDELSLERLVIFVGAMYLLTSKLFTFRKSLTCKQTYSAILQKYFISAVHSSYFCSSTRFIVKNPHYQLMVYSMTTESTPTYIWIEIILLKNFQINHASLA